ENGKEHWLREPAESAGAQQSEPGEQAGDAIEAHEHADMSEDGEGGNEELEIARMESRLGGPAPPDEQRQHSGEENCRAAQSNAARRDQDEQGNKQAEARQADLVGRGLIAAARQPGEDLCEPAAVEDGWLGITDVERRNGT